MNTLSDNLVLYLKTLIDEHPRNYTRIINADKDLLKQITDATPLLVEGVHTLKTRIYWIISGLKDFPKCEGHGGSLSDVNVSNIKNGYPRFCCRECMYKSDAFKQSITTGIFDKYGVHNAFQIDSVKADLRMRAGEIQRKRDETYRKHFGNEPGRNLVKSLKTRIERYGGPFKKSNNDKIQARKCEMSADDFYDHYGRDAFEKFQSMSFPFQTLDIVKFRKELVNLSKNDFSDTIPSYIIRSMHHSMYYACKKNKKSPYDFWNLFKDESYFQSGAWRKFYINRFKYCNTADGKILRQTGNMSAKMILSGFSITHLADCVSYLKPALAKRLARTYLYDVKEIFCPFNGFSGIMLGCTVGCEKKFIGRDINRRQIEESRQIAEMIKAAGYNIDVDLDVADVFESSGIYQSMLCCPPYQDIEKWNFDASGKCLDENLTCDEWIDVCISRFKCRRYIFVVDDKSTVKYRKNVVETIRNRSHFGNNTELVVMINA